MSFNKTSLFKMYSSVTIYHFQVDLSFKITLGVFLVEKYLKEKLLTCRDGM